MAANKTKRESYVNRGNPSLETAKRAIDILSWGFTGKDVCADLGLAPASVVKAFERAGQPTPYAVRQEYNRVRRLIRHG